MNRHWMQFSIGMVTILSLFALAALVVWFGELQTLFKPKRTYYVTFTNAQGAEPKAPVRRAGMRIGEISKVEYDEKTGLIIVTIVLEGDNRLQEGDEPRLRTNSFFIGDAYVDIETRKDMLGRADRRTIPTGSVLEGRPPVDFGPAAESASDLVPNANRTLDNLTIASKQWNDVGVQASRIMEQNEREINLILQQTRDAVEKLNTTLGSINDTLDQKTQQNIRTTVQNITDASADLGPLVDSSNEAIKQITNTTQKLDEVAQNLQKATKPLADRSDSTIRNLDETTHNMTILTAELTTMLQRFQRSDGSIKRLLEDPKLYQHLNSAAVKLDRSLGELEVIMRDMQVFSDKIARHPGELGVQGVLTRDNGDKNVPPSALKDSSNHRRR